MIPQLLKNLKKLQRTIQVYKMDQIEMHMTSLVMMVLIPLALEAAALKALMIFLAISSVIYLVAEILLDVDSDLIKVQIYNTP